MAAATPEHPLLAKWADAFIASYMNTSRIRLSYFQLHGELSRLYDNDVEVQKMLDQMPQVSADASFGLSTCARCCHEKIARCCNENKHSPHWKMNDLETPVMYKRPIELDKAWYVKRIADLIPRTKILQREIAQKKGLAILNQLTH